MPLTFLYSAVHGRHVPALKTTETAYGCNPCRPSQVRGRCLFVSLKDHTPCSLHTLETARPLYISVSDARAISRAHTKATLVNQHSFYFFYFFRRGEITLNERDSLSA